MFSTARKLCLPARDGDELEAHYRHARETLGKRAGMRGVIFRRAKLPPCLLFLSENGLLPDEKLAADAWETLTLDVAAGRLDREQTTARLRKLLRSHR